MWTTEAALLLSFYLSAAALSLSLVSHEVKTAEPRKAAEHVAASN